MDSFEQDEKECARIEEENEKLLDDFGEWLEEKGIAPKTIDRHLFNVELYINEFLLNSEAMDAAEGIDEIGEFLGYWFIKKAMWANKSQIKKNATSLKKFYQFMLEKGKISQESYKELEETIKEEMQEWLDTMDRYDDPDIEDMEEVWGI